MEHNGFEYVDLGLPSGTLWATCNVGADTPLDSGLYFQWGDTIGYTENDVKNSTKIFYDPFYPTHSAPNRCILSKYNRLKLLEPYDDAVHTHMGGYWRMPTRYDFLELLKECHTLRVFENDTNYLKVISKTHIERELKIPFVGFMEGYFLDSQNVCLRLWSSSRGFIDGAAIAFTVSHRTDPCIDTRKIGYGYNVRGVVKRY